MPLSYSRTWDDVLALSRGHAELILAIAGVFLFVPALVGGLVIPDPQTTARDLLGMINERLAHLQQYQLPMLLLALPVALGQAAILALILDPARPTVAQALRTGLFLLVSFFLLNVLVNIATGIGLALLIAPGLYLIGRLLPASPAMAGEHILNPLTAFGRGWKISRKNGWRIFGIVAIVFIVGYALQLAITAVVGITGSFLLPPEGARVARVFVAALLSTVFGTVLLVLAAAVYRALIAQPPVPSSSGV